MQNNPTFFHQPIPGYGLTAEPGSVPWERPPELVTLEDVLDYYSDKFTDPELIGNLLDTISKNIPLMAIADGILKSSIMEGKHSIDVGFLVKPILIEMMIAIAEVNDTGFVVEEEDFVKMTTMPLKLVSKVVDEAKKAGKQFADEESVQEPVQEPAQPPAGLMVKRGV